MIVIIRFGTSFECWADFDRVFGHVYDMHSKMSSIYFLVHLPFCALIFSTQQQMAVSLFLPNVVTSFMQLIHFSLYYLLFNFGLITMFIAFARKMKTQNSLRPGCLCVCWCCFCVNFIENLYRFIKSHSFLLLHRFSAQ